MASTDLPDRLTRTRRRGRRWLLRHRRGLAALLLGVATVATLRTVSPAPPDRAEVVVAAADLPAGSEVSADDVTTVRVPRDAVPDGAQEAADIVGRTLAGPLRRGEPVTDVGLVGDRMLAGYPGKVAVPVRIPDAATVALLRSGDRIDLVATEPSTGGSDQVASGAQVIAVPPADSGTTAPGRGVSGRLVVLAVTPTEGRNIADAAARGYLTVMFSG